MVNFVVGSSNSSTMSRKLSVDVAKFRKLSGIGKMSRRRCATAEHTQSGHGSKRIGVPELSHDSGSELGTPLVTPTDNEFVLLQIKKDMLGPADMDQDMPPDEGVTMELDSYPLFEEHNKENIPPTTKVSGCPPAPRIDTGIFDYNLTLNRSRNSSFDPGMTLNSSTNTSTEDSSLVSSGGQMSLDDLFTPSEIAVEGILTDSGLLGDDRGPLKIPRAPRPDTGTWSSSTENVAPGPGAYWYQNPRKTWALQFREENSQPQHFTPSVTLNAQSELGSTSEYASKRSAGWNLGLGLTLDMIAEPSCCGSIGEVSMDFTEDSFFDVELGGYLTADSTMESPDLATTCPRGGSSFRSTDSSEALHKSGVTPRFETLSLQDQINVKTRQRGHIAPRSRTQLFAYTNGATIAKNAPVERPQALSQGEFCGWTDGTRLVGATLGFSSRRGESFSTGSHGGSCDLDVDDGAFALLPPVEL